MKSCLYDSPVGQPAFRQPIQLPVFKIPINESVEAYSGNKNPPSDRLNSAEVIQSPPELLNSYQEDPEPGRSGSSGNFYQRGAQRPPIRQYYGGVSVGPYIQENPAPVPYRTIHANGPVGMGGRNGQPTPPSFMEAISNFFFG